MSRLCRQMRRRALDGLHKLQLSDIGAADFQRRMQLILSASKPSWISVVGKNGVLD